jgi:hypothetical protein
MAVAVKCGQLSRGMLVEGATPAPPPKHEHRFPFAPPPADCRGLVLAVQKMAREHVESKNIRDASIMKLQFHPGTDIPEAVAYLNHARASMLRRPERSDPV